MGMPMEEILHELPLDPDLTETLLGTTNQLTRMLHLVSICERGDFEGMSVFAQAEDIRPAAIGNMYTESMQWAMEILGKSAA
jgi:c-di-GMP-related signal transduction protein